MFNLDEYRISFSYNNDERKATICKITLDENIVGIGIVKFNPKDHIYTKNEGRKRSLTKALQMTGFNKEFRKRVWEEYAIRRNGKFD